MRALSAALLVLLFIEQGARAAAPPISIDPTITRLVAEVSPHNLQDTDTHLIAFGTRSTFSEHSPPGRGVAAAADWLTEQFRQIAATSKGRLTVSRDEYLQHADAHRVPRDVPISSVIATLPGTDATTRTYVISAHYDSRNSDDNDGTADAPGADDNASGTAAVLEAARVLAPTHPRATIIFAIYDAEEQGLFGSAHHAAALKAAGIDVQADLNNDIVGAAPPGQADTVRIFSEALPTGADPARINRLGTENDSPSRELARTVQATGDAYVPGLHGALVNRADRVLRGGDHLSFNAQGYPAIRFTEPVETFTHQHQNVREEGGTQYGDLQRYMDFAYLAQVTRYNVAVLASLAESPASPRPVMDMHELTNTTTLTWPPVPGAARYEVLRRRTTDASWTDITLAPATSITLPYSKDEWIFAVRAIDAAGHASVPAIPTPQR